MEEIKNSCNYRAPANKQSMIKKSAKHLVILKLITIFADELTKNMSYVSKY